MATSSSNPTLVDRTEVHKSCKSLELIANMLNDYCQAADTMVLTQKKLAKSLREMHNLKGVSDIIANAMNAVAGIFETLAEVDQKFIKIADKECESVSSDLKKWFKKLAKEEKSHDDKIAVANLKIKQAGQAFERKAKWKDRDAADEHSRYVTVLNTVGPEMSQEKFNHTLLVTQRHTSTLYAVASCLSKIADAEWTRSCECVRKFSPAIGHIGELRAYLEGAYLGSLPVDFPESEANDVPARVDQEQQIDHVPQQYLQETGNNSRGFNPGSIPNGSFSVDKTSPAQSLQNMSSVSLNDSVQADSTLPQYSAPVRPFQVQQNHSSVRSLESLSAFPTPPGHFPLPPVSQSDSTQGSETSPYRASRTPLSAALPASRDYPLSSSPIQSSATEGVKSVSSSEHSRSYTPAYNSTSGLTTPRDDSRFQSPLRDGRNSQHGSSVDGHIRTGGSDARLSSEGPIAVADRGDVVANNADNTINEDLQHNANMPMHSNGIPTATDLARMSSVTSLGSRVAAMRDRLSSQPGPSSPRPRDVPRLPQSVSDLANRYTPLDNSPPPANSIAAINSPDRPRQSFDHAPRRRSSRAYEQPSPQTDKAAHAVVSDSPQPASPRTENSQQRGMGVAERQLRERGLELRERERETEQLARNLEHDIARLLDTKSTSGAVRTPMTTEPLNVRSSSRPHSHYSRSTTNLMLPADNGRSWSMYQDNQKQAQSSASLAHRPSDHAPFCGCEACSVAQYSGVGGQQPTAYDLRPPDPPISLRPEKPKGWMRRLSMPMVDAFTSDSKKSTSQSLGIAGRNYSYGIASPTSPTEDGRLISQSLEHSATGGVSNIRTRKISFGRR